MAYLDYNASAPLTPTAVAAMVEVLEGDLGNPSSIHVAGRKARAHIDDARDRVAELLGVAPGELIFTGGGTESCNLGVIGLARAHVPRGKHLVATAIEHPAVLHAVEYLQHYEGFEVTILPVDSAGRVDPDDFLKFVRPDTTLVSVMHANNETGVVQPVAEIAGHCRERGIIFHTDAIQSFGKIPCRPRELGVRAMSLASHKIGGPTGVGVLVLEAGVAISRITHGGAQENARRAGTENALGIVGFAAAAAEAVAGLDAESERLLRLREELWNGISAVFPLAIRNGDPEWAMANTLNVSFPGIDGEALLIGLDLEGISASSGSACMVGAIRPSHVLVAMGASPRDALAAIRFSLGARTSSQDIGQAISAVRKVLQHQATCVP